MSHLYYVLFTNVVDMAYKYKLVRYICMELTILPLKFTDAAQSIYVLNSDNQMWKNKT